MSRSRVGRVRIRYNNRKVILCEVDEVLAGIGTYLITVKASKIRAIPDLEPGQTVTDLAICQEAQWLFGFG